MRPTVRHGLRALLLCLLVAFGLSPLFQAGLLARDLRALLEGAAANPWAGWFGAAPGPAPPLTLVSLSLSLAWIPAGHRVVLLRLENLVLLVVAAYFLGLFVRRLLLPWLGSQQAALAARASGALFLLHPLAVMALASVEARGDLLAVALGFGAAALFLRGRQDRRLRTTASAWIVALLSGLASHGSLALIPLFGLAELLSSHRYRPRVVRWRTTLTTSLLFGAALSLDLLVVAARHGTESVELPFTAAAPQAGWAMAGVEKLGLLFLPSNPFVLGVAGTILAGVAFLLALQPALAAARSAPRLWGWLLVSWLALLVWTALLHADLRVTPRELARAHGLLFSSAVLAVGLGLGATALAGPRRPYIAWAVAFAYAALCHGNARPWVEASARAASLRRDLLEVDALRAPGVSLLLLDGGGPVEGVEPVGLDLAWLLHPGWDGGDPAAPVASDVHGLSSDAFLALVSEPEFEPMIARGLLVVVPRETFTSAGALGLPSGERSVVRLDAPLPSAPARSWSRELRSPILDLDPLAFEALRVTVEVDEPPGLGRLSWTTVGEQRPRGGFAEPAWLRSDGRVEGWVDLARSLSWRLSGRVRLLLFDEGQGSLSQAELLPRLAAFEGTVAPERDGRDWLFSRPSDPVPVEGAVTYHLGLFDPVRLRWLELPAATQGPDTLRFRGAADFALATQSGPIAWTLEARVDGRAVGRARGRIDP